METERLFLCLPRTVYSYVITLYIYILGRRSLIPISYVPASHSNYNSYSTKLIYKGRIKSSGNTSIVLK
jgi:hypothetical protein